MGKMHQSRFKIGDRINNSFTLVRNYMRKTTIKGKNEWLWECKCDCGNIFHCRENKLLTRKGCHSCTNKISQTEVSQAKTNGIKHYGLKNRLYKDYKTGAVRRGKCFELSFEEFVNLIEQNCYYCGSSPEFHPYETQYMQKTIETYKHNGIDRINSNKGYTLDNCVPCCSKCNYAKHEMSIEEFKNFVQKLYNNFILKGSSTISKESTSEANADGNGVIPKE